MADLWTCLLGSGSLAFNVPAVTALDVAVGSVPAAVSEASPLVLLTTGIIVARSSTWSVLSSPAETAMFASHAYACQQTRFQLAHSHKNGYQGLDVVHMLHRRRETLARERVP